MLQRHGHTHYDFMPETYMLPTQLPVFEEQLRSRGRTPAGAKDVWILKPVPRLSKIEPEPLMSAQGAVDDT